MLIQEFRKNQGFIAATYDNTKIQEKPGLHPLFRKYIFGKTKCGGQIDSRSRIRFKFDNIRSEIWGRFVRVYSMHPLHPEQIFQYNSRAPYNNAIKL